MTGKELMYYIMDNDLADKQLFKDGRFLDFLTVEETAVRLEVGVPTVKTLFSLDMIDGVKIGDTIYIHPKMLELYIKVSKKGLTI